LKKSVLKALFAMRTARENNNGEPRPALAAFEHAAFKLQHAMSLSILSADAETNQQLSTGSSSINSAKLLQFCNESVILAVR
jgi:hypothetical protein